MAKKRRKKQGSIFSDSLDKVGADFEKDIMRLGNKADKNISGSVDVWSSKKRK